MVRLDNTYSRKLINVVITYELLTLYIRFSRQSYRPVSFVLILRSLYPCASMWQAEKETLRLKLLRKPRGEPVSVLRKLHLYIQN